MERLLLCLIISQQDMKLLLRQSNICRLTLNTIIHADTALIYPFTSQYILSTHVDLAL